MAETTDESMPFDVRPDVRATRGPHPAAGFAHMCASICELAAAVFDLPMAALSLRDGEAMTPVAAFGIADIDVLDALAFTRRPLIAGEGLRIADAAGDPRYFLESPVLRAPHIRFYADMPLVHEGEILGVIAIAGAAPYPDFPAAKQAVLTKFADQAATLLALAQERTGSAPTPQKRLDMAAELAGLGYWTIDLATREVVWSKGLYALLGLSENLHRPRVETQLDIYAAADRPAVIERFQQAVNTGADFDFELRITRRKDKAARLIRTKGGVEYDGDGAPVRLCAVVRDVTETAIGDAFLGHVADDLRDPLNEIAGYVRRMETQPASSRDIAGYAQDLLAAAEALQGRIGDAPAPEPAAAIDEDEAVDVAEMIRETVAGFTFQAGAAQTRLGTHFVDFTRAMARIDAMRVRQVLQNLLSNACKFTRGGVISVTASQVTAENPRTLRPETHLHVSVRDSGIGMDEAVAHSLFTDGHKGPGRGLGLSVARTIVEMLGGHIGAVSRPGEGTKVWFEIPVEWVEGPAVKPDPKAAPVPQTLTRQNFDTRQSRPAYAPLRPRFEAPPAKPAAVDEDRINREYLRALLQDMKVAGYET